MQELIFFKKEKRFVAFSYIAKYQKNRVYLLKHLEILFLLISLYMYVTLRDGIGSIALSIKMQLISPLLI